MLETTTAAKIVSKIRRVDTGGPEDPQTPKITSSPENGWDKAIRWIVYGLTFLLPVLFTPWTFEPLEFSKQMLLFIAVAAALVAWLLKLLVLRNWRFIKTPLDVPILVFLLVYLLSAIFSVDRIASFMGFYGSFSGNFFQVLFLVLFYYLVVNNFSSLGELKQLFNIFVLSTFVAVTYAVLQFFGFFIFPLQFAKVESFNTIGSLLMLSLFAAIVLVLAIGHKSRSWFRVDGNAWKIIAVIASLIIMFTVNFLFAWIVLLLGILLQIVYKIASLGQTFTVKKILTPLVLLIVVVAFLIVQLVFPFISLRSIFSFNLPVEVRLDYSTAQPVISGTVSENPILGSGPNTFLYAFSEHRDQDFNLSPFWNVRFDKAPSEAVELLVGTGILGFLAFEILSIIFLVYGFFFMSRKRNPETWSLLLVLLAVFASLWLAHWFFFFNTVMAFAYWLIMAIFMAVSKVAGSERVKSLNFSLSQSPRQTVGIVTGISFALVLVVVFIFFAASIYSSDIFYRQGLVASNDVETLDEAQADFELAIRLNRFRPDYYLTYGEFLSLRINQELTKTEPNLGLIQQWLASSINVSRAAVDLSPNNWTSWERLANLYSFARPLVAGVDRFILESLQRATENDPNNPILFTELGAVYRLSARRIDPGILGTGADTDSDGLSDEQEQILGSSPNDPDSNGNNVLDGNEVLAGLNPTGSGPLPDSFLSQYLRTDPENLLNAEQSFQKAIELKPDYATAHLQLGQTLQQAGKDAEATTVLEESLEVLSRNVDLKFELGRLNFNTGNINGAVKQFQEILSLVPTHSNARFSLALAYERLGNPQRALLEYRRVLELNPDNESLKQRVQALEAQIVAPPPEE